MIASKWCRFALVCLLLGAGAVTGSAQDTGWPREIKHPQATVLIYQPQPESLKGDLVAARSAVSVTLKGKPPVFGVAWIEARLAIDKTARTAVATSLKVTRTRFPEAKPEQEQQLVKAIEEGFASWDKSMDYDRLLASLAAAEREQEAASDIGTDPPRILVEKVPAMLVLIDGEPQLAEIPGTGVKRVVNSPLFIAHDEKSRTYYLDGTQVWFKTGDLTGAWVSVAADAVPPPIRDVAEKSRQAAVADGIEAGDGEKAAATAEEKRLPKIVVSLVPAELIAFDGEPNLTPVIGVTDLLYASNTLNRVLMDVGSQKYFVLLSGRWYQAATLEGPWAFVKPAALPASFARIPETSPVGDVLVHVPGTPQAEEAVADAQVPQTAAIRRSEARLEVAYDGTPRFEQVPGTEVAYAQNTSTQVMKIGDHYYAVDNGVWFIAVSPMGPWALSDHNPQQVQSLPPSCPVYNTKYVYVYDTTPEIVYVGYTPGYVGCYPYHGVIVYGTGYYYRPWAGAYYYPRPPTWGMSVAYNPWTGWTVGVGYAYGPVRLGVAWGGGYHGGGYYGGWYHGGHCPPRPPYHGGGYHPVNIGARPGQRPGQGRPGNNVYDRGPTKDRVAPGPDRGRQPAGKPAAADRSVGGRGSGKPNNVYADRDGNVYRQNDKGAWQQNRGKDWAPVQGRQSPARPAPAARPAQPSYRDKQGLDREAYSRRRGDDRARSFQQPSRPSPQRQAPAQRSAPRGGRGR